MTFDDFSSSLLKAFEMTLPSSSHSGDAFNLSIYRCYSLQQITRYQIICEDDDDGDDGGDDDGDDDDSDGDGDRIIRLVFFPIYGLSPQRNHQRSQYLFSSKLYFIFKKLFLLSLFLCLIPL